MMNTNDVVYRNEESSLWYENGCLKNDEWTEQLSVDPENDIDHDQNEESG